jgi:hypothetical protein
MNTYDNILFNDKIKKINSTRNKNNSDTISSNEYRNLDVSEFPNFKKNMKKYRKRLFDLLKTMLQSNNEKFKNEDEHDIITMKFIELSYEIFEHFNNLEKINNVNDQFSILNKIDKVLLSNNSS